MALTRNNIALKLSLSPFKHTVQYSDCEITYVFSSELYRGKFKDRLLSNREQFEESLSKRFGFIVKPGLLADLKLYTTIEKRGFLLFKNGVEIECHQEIIFDGVKMTLQNSAE